MDRKEIIPSGPDPGEVKERPSVKPLGAEDLLWVLALHTHELS